MDGFVVFQLQEVFTNMAFVKKSGLRACLERGLLSASTFQSMKNEKVITTLLN
jgi:hypothetical protein